MARILPIRQRQFPRFTQVYSSLTDKSLESKNLEQESMKCQDRLKQFISHEAYNLSMALLTIYSIFAIDIEKAAFGQSAAYIFGYVHIVAIIIFMIEMTLNSIGKQGYKASFYFWIDLISTISMTMQITWVDNYLAANSNLPGVLTIAKVVKASRLSRIGSRAAKIIFLFLQYFKNKKDEEERIKLQNKQEMEVGDESNMKTQTAIESRNKDEIDNVLEDDGFHHQIMNQLPKKFDYKKNGLQPIQQEKITQKSDLEEKIVSHADKSSQSRSKQSVLQPILLLGKRRSKLSHPSQTINLKKRTDKSRTFQISNILQRMEQTFKLQPLERPNVDPKKKEQIQKKWQEICQRELQANKQQKQKIKSDKQNFKLGQTLKQRIQKNIIIMIMSLIIILPLISADTWLNKDPTIDQLMQNYIQFASTLDEADAEMFLRDIVLTANYSTYPILLLELPTNSTQLQYPGNIIAELDNSPPLNDFMEVEIINASLTNASLSNTSLSSFTLIFNGRNIDQITALINIARSCFITVLLIFSTIIFMHSIESKALAPLQNMCKSINKISVNPFDALKEVNQKDEKQIEKVDKNDLQTNMLERTIWKMTKIVALGAGQTGSELISTKIDYLNSDMNYIQFEGSKIHGVFLAVRIAEFEQSCRKNQQNLLTFINNITKNLHQIATGNAGIILESNPPHFLFFWKTPEDLHIQHQPTKYYVANNPLKNLGKTVQTQKIIQIVLRTYLKMCLSLVEQNKKRLKQENIEDQYEFSVLQAGIHLGDAYQGSVGNKYKIQVKAIGDDVDFVKKLSFLSQKYALSNIVSYEIYDILDDATENNLRKIDYVKEPNWEDEFWLCTFDFTLIPIVQPNKFKANRKKKNRVLQIQKNYKSYRERNLVYNNRRAEILSKLNCEPIDTIMPFTSIQKICLKSKSYNNIFYPNWNEAIERYYGSQWDIAAEFFQKINMNLQYGYKDPISMLFLERIDKKGGEAPNEWDKAVLLEEFQL